MNRPPLDPDLLRAFLAVAERKSFTRAAAGLNRTQSAVSVQIKRLEALVGAALFTRSTARVELTAAGEGLVGYARRILALGEEALHSLRRHGVVGRVRIGAMDDYGTMLLPAILKNFCDAYPGIDLEMETGLTGGMAARLGASYDLVLAMHAAGESAGELGGELLRREKALWVGSDTFAPRDIDPLPLALYPPGCLFRKWALEALDRVGRKWRLAFVSHSLAAVAAIAAQGLAVTVVKAGTIPSGLRVFGPSDKLPSLPKADIRLHVASAPSVAARLLAGHLRDHLGPRAKR